MKASMRRSMKASMRRLVWIGVLLGAILPADPVYPQDTGGDWRSDVDRFARRLVEAGFTPGMGIAVTRGDSVLHVGGFGVADAGSGRAVDRETLFYIASSTKALTATAVVLLARRSELELDAPVTRYLPELRLGAPLDADSVTIRDLLTMTHGIADGGPVVFRTAYTGDFTGELLVDLLAGYGPSDSGRAFAYGNLGYNILGWVLDPADPHGWKDVVERDVLDPLGMEATSARLSALDPDRLAMPHEIDPGGTFRRIPLAKSDETLHAAGGHFATPRDLARFVAAQASGGVLEGRRVFPRAAIESTHQKHAEQDRVFGPFHRFGWGFGWDLGTYEGRTVVHRFGSFSGYRSHMSFMPEPRIGAVVLVNGGGPASPAADLMATYIYDRLLEKPGLEEEYAARFAALQAQFTSGMERMAQQLVERRARAAPLSHPLEAFAGAYENPKLGRMELRVVDEGLEVRVGVAASRAEIFDAAEDKLRIEITGGGEVVDFEFTAEADAASSLEYRGERFVRVES
jgi:CubicO group peptidase (beta-lactamase class C family)